MSGDERDRRKGMANEILPDPSQAKHDLAEGGPRGRTIEHLKRILAAAALTVAASGCTPSGGAADKKAGDAGTKEAAPDGRSVPPPPPQPPPPIVDPGYGVVDPLPDPSYRSDSERRHHKAKKKADGEKKGK